MVHRTDDASCTETRNKALQGVFLTCGLNRQLAKTLRVALWFAMWFVISSRPRSWARQAEAWQDAAGRRIWSSEFSRVHAIMWRLILSYLLFSLVRLLAAAAGKALSLQFHHRQHFTKMQAWPLSLAHAKLAHA